MEIKTSPKYLRLFYFWSGVIATFAYRIIIVLNYYSNTWVKISWYVGTIGFIIYFIHRFEIAKKRASLVQDHRLIQKMDHLEDLTAEDRQALSYILKTTVSSKAKWNYYVIFILSALALIAGIFLDFVIKK